ncbi:MAG TPA: AsmA-like C-terminal region-containing protein [Oligoflexus sp.]|uniref:AsmA family protein n=1 Tax=Oligoflexus sp. TaxID=1971216 RepID=UPI002D696539|nr:AsmA-like C-terminal region-containing protein [Oligoflexus sp.]HYX34560.1 AsmA-like C-terminal region-containing protein [Oligoflexus sp.]
MRILRITLGTFAGALMAVMILLLGLVQVVNRVNWNKHLDFVARTTEKFTDWQVKGLEGLDIHLGTRTSFSVEGLSLQAGNGARLESVSARHASLVLRPWTLLKNQIVIQDITIKDARVVIDSTQTSADDKQTPLEKWPALFVQQASIDDFEIHILRDAHKYFWDFSVDHLQVRSETPQSPVNVHSHGQALDMPYQLSGTLGSFQKFRSGGNDYPIQLNMELARQNLQVAGNFQPSKNSFDLNVKARGSDYDFASQLLGSRYDLKKAPAYDLSVQIIRNPESWTVKNLIMNLGKSHLEGNGMFKPTGHVPWIEAELRASLLRYQDFMAFLPDSKVRKLTNAQVQQPQRWGDFSQLIPTQFLQNYESRVHLLLTDVLGRENQSLLQNLDTTVSLKNGRLTMDPLTVSVPGGDIRSSLMVDSQKKCIQITLDRQGKDFNFMQTMRSFIKNPEPWPVRYFSAHHMALNVQWPAPEQYSALRVSFKVKDARVQFNTVTPDGKKKKPKQKGFQEQLAEYPSVVLESGDIQGLRWVYLKEGQDIGGFIESLHLSSIGADRPFHVTSHGQVMKLPYRFSARLGSYDELRDSKQTFPVEFKGMLGGQTLHVTGGLRPAQSIYKFDVAGSGEHLARLKPLLAVAVGRLPPYNFQFKLTHEPGLLTIESMTVNLGQSSVTGALTLSLGASQPLLSGRLLAPLLRYEDIDGLWTENDPAPGPKPRKGQRPGALLSDQALPFHLLHHARADLFLEVKRYQGPASGWFLAEAEARLRLFNGRLILSPINIASSIGQAGGMVTVDARRKPVQLSADLGLEVYNMATVARRLSLALPTVGLSPRELVKGNLTGTLELKSEGSSPRRLVAAADGHMQLVIDDGHIAATVLEALSMDLVETLATLVKDHPPTKINCMFASYSVDNGVIKTDHFFLSTKDSNVKLSGRLDLNRQLIDVKFETFAKDFSFASVGSPVYLKGSLGDIKVSTSRKELILKATAAIALGTLINPVMALVPFIDLGLEKKGQCVRYTDRIVRLQYKADERISAH